MENLKILENIEYISNPTIVNNNQTIGTIYCFINKVNSKLYIGKTVQSNYKMRFKSHKYNALKKDCTNHFAKAIRKYGWDSFISVVLY